MDNKGFTLIELLIVVAIIGILAMAATTAYVGTIKKAARSEAYSNLETLRLLEEQVYSENGVYFPDTTEGHANPTTGISNIQTIIPGFKPGTGNSFDYSIIADVRLPNSPAIPFDPASVAAQTDPPCFVAIATGIASTRVTGDVYAIDCNNNRNF